MVADRDDNIIVMDGGNYRVQKFTSEGEFLTEVGTSGSNPLQFRYPTGASISSTDDKVYITDQDNHKS